MRWPGDHRGGFAEMVELVTICHQLTLGKFCDKRISLLLNIVAVKKNFIFYIILLLTAVMSGGNIGVR